MRHLRAAAVAVLASFTLALAPGDALPPVESPTLSLSPEVREFVRVDAPSVALTHVRVIDGTGAEPKENQTVVIAQGKIAAIGPAGTTAVPPGARTIDLAGASVLPGLVGMHDHRF